MRFFLCTSFVLFATVLQSTEQSISANNFILVRDNQPEAVIVCEDATNKELYTHIQIFNKELKCCTKTTLPVVKTAGKDQNRIIFRLEKRSIRDLDSFMIDFPDLKTLRITGSTNSVRWAFNYILERELGIRWLFPPIKGLYGSEINHYPQLRTASVKRETFSNRPAAWISRFGDWRTLSFAANWNANRRIMLSHGMSIDVFPVYKYAPDRCWPKAILPVVNGKIKVMPEAKLPLSSNPWRAAAPFREGWQPCWSNLETTEIAIENIMEILKKNPNKKIINMDVNDNYGYCECENCRRAVAGKRNLSRMLNYSELYWSWVNKVASAVAEKYPDVIFSAMAYREVLAPPSFKIHPKILPRLCIELATMTDPVWYGKRIKLIRDWAEKASMLDLYDYMHGIDFFVLPRIYFNSHSKILSDLILKYKLRSAYFESEGQTVFQGPQQQLMIKLLWNPNLDVEAFLKDWCEHAVGKKAAQHLLEYYRLWEDYWTGKDIKKTPWYASVGNVYMQLGERNSHTYALKKGDMKKFRSCMEKVVALAETPEQKKRAQILMQAFEYSELAAIIAFSEIFPPDGQLHSVEQAKELVAAIPASIRARKKLLNHPLIQFDKQRGKGMITAADSSLGKLIPYLEDKQIRETIDKLTKDSAVPSTLRAQFKIWLGAKAVNLIANGSFEQEASPFFAPSRRGKRDSQYVSDGKYAFKTGNGFYLIRSKIERGKIYMFLCDFYIQKGSGEGRFRTRIGVAKGNIPVGWTKNEIIPTGGSWNTCCTVIGSGKTDVDTLLIQLHFQKFEKNEPVWIDHLRLYCLDDLIQTQ